MTYPQINKEILQKFMVVTTAVMGIEVQRSKEENKTNVLAITSGAPPMTEKWENRGQAKKQGENGKKMQY